eukprot:8993901-Ditylum_brightwellii.AAC.1
MRTVKSADIADDKPTEGADMNHLTTSNTEDELIRTSYGIFGYNTLISMDSPSIQIILEQIDNAMLNIAEKEFCATKFVVLDTKLKELKNYVSSCKGLPSFKVSILLTLCTFIRCISKRKTSRNGANASPGPTRKTKPFEGQDRRNSLEGINSPSTTEATNSPPKKKKKSLIAMISKKMKTKKAKGQNIRDAHEDILPPSPTEVITSSPKKGKKSLMAKISKNMKKIKRR